MNRPRDPELARMARIATDLRASMTWTTPVGVSVWRPGTSTWDPRTTAEVELYAGAAPNFNPPDGRNGDILVVVPASSPPSFTTQSPPAGVVGVAYSYTYTTNIPATFSVSSGSLPGGLSLSAGGVLSGTPTTTTGSPFTFVVTATANGLSTSTPTQSVAITASSNTLTIVTSTVANWSVSTNCSGVASDGVNQHGGSNTVTMTASNAGGQLWQMMYTALVVTAGLSYSMPTCYGLDPAGTANRKMYVTFFWQPPGGGSNLSNISSSPLIPLTNAWQAIPGFTNQVAPAGAGQVQVVVTIQSTDAGTPANGEVGNFATT